MAKPRMDLSAFVGKLLEEQDGDVLREGIRVLSQALMETEVAGLIGAERHERSDSRTAFRNGYRTRTWDTRVGTIELQIPKVRSGTYFPSLLTIERALAAIDTIRKQSVAAFSSPVADRALDELKFLSASPMGSPGRFFRIERPIEGPSPPSWRDNPSGDSCDRRFRFVGRKRAYEFTSMPSAVSG